MKKIIMFVLVIGAVLITGKVQASQKGINEFETNKVHVSKTGVFTVINGSNRTQKVKVYTYRVIKPLGYMKPIKTVYKTSVKPHHTIKIKTHGCGNVSLECDISAVDYSTSYTYKGIKKHLKGYSCNYVDYSNGKVSGRGNW
jgi:hypothetical protein